MKSNSFLIKLIMYLFIFVLVFPLIILLIWNFANRWPWPNLIPSNFGLRGIKYFFDPTTKSLNILFNSIILSLTVTFITLSISIPAAKALGVYNFKGKKIIKLLVLAPLIVPPVSVAMGIHLAFIKMKLANTFLGVVLVHLIPTLPYAIRILTDVFEITGNKLEQQASVLGANSLQRFLYITLPTISPGIISAGSISFIVSFSQYFLTFLIGGGRVLTLPIIMFPFIQSGDRMMASVYSTFFILTTLLILYIMEKLVKNYYKSENNFYM